MTKRTAIGETLFAMAFGIEAVIPVEVGLPSLRVENYNEEDNPKQMIARTRFGCGKTRASFYLNSCA